MGNGGPTIGPFQPPFPIGAVVKTRLYLIFREPVWRVYRLLSTVSSAKTVGAVGREENDPARETKVKQRKKNSSLNESVILYENWGAERYDKSQNHETCVFLYSPAEKTLLEKSIDVFIFESSIFLSRSINRVIRERRKFTRGCNQPIIKWHIRKDARQFENFNKERGNIRWKHRVYMCKFICGGII